MVETSRRTATPCALGCALHWRAFGLPRTALRRWYWRAMSHANYNRMLLRAAGLKHFFEATWRAMSHANYNRMLLRAAGLRHFFEATMRHVTSTIYEEVCLKKPQQWVWIPKPLPGDWMNPHTERAYRYCMRRVFDRDIWIYDPDQGAKYRARKQTARKRSRREEARVLGHQRRREGRERRDRIFQESLRQDSD
jgi:hypothetical protein